MTSHLFDSIFKLQKKKEYMTYVKLNIFRLLKSLIGEQLFDVIKRKRV